jgi:hypothetical protein
MKEPIVIPVEKFTYIPSRKWFTANMTDLQGFTFWSQDFYIDSTTKKLYHNFDIRRDQDGSVIYAIYTAVDGSGFGVTISNK